MRTLILCTILLCLTSYAHTQTCLPGGITFFLQSQINNFQTDYPGCTHIEGNVTIQSGSPQITNLNGLSVLTRIDGNLRIAQNHALSSLSGLDNVTDIGGYLTLSNNTALTSLSGLDNLAHIGGGLSIGSHANLTGIDALALLTNIPADVVIGGNDMLTDLDGLHNVISMGNNLNINNNDALTNLNGLEALTSVGNVLLVNGNAVMQNLAGLEGLTSLGSWMEINDNPQLINLTGLEGLTTFNNDVSIHDNPALVSLDGLENITTINGFLAVFDNDALPDLAGLEALNSITGNFTISRNDVLANLSGVDALSSIGGFVSIHTNAALLNLDGLDALSSVGWNLNIFANAALQNINALSNLTAVDGWVFIQENDVLTSLSGLENINHTMLSDLILRDSPLLSVCEVQSLCDYLDIASNPATISGNAPGCDTRTAVETACDAALPVELINFAGEKKNEGVVLSWQTASERNNAGFEIVRAPDGLRWERIGFISGQGTSTGHQSYTHIDTHPKDGLNYYRLKQIDHSGHSTTSDIITITINRKADITLHPNPVQSVLNIELMAIPDMPVRIYNAGGMLVKTLHPDTNTFTLNVDHFESGLYIVKTQARGQVHTKRFVKR